VLLTLLFECKELPNRIVSTEVIQDVGNEAAEEDDKEDDVAKDAEDDKPNVD
jgi:hypothetical protein